MNLFKYIYSSIRIIGGFYRILFYKMINGNNLKVKKILYTSLGKYSSIDMKSKTCIKIGFKFHCREFVKLKTSSEGKITIGDNVFMNRGCSVTSHHEVVIGDNCLFGEDVKIYDHDHIFLTEEPIRTQGFKYDSVIIGNNVWIGSNCIILKGIEIGDNSIIGANTLINKNIPSNSVVHNSNKLVVKSR